MRRDAILKFARDSPYIIPIFGDRRRLVVIPAEDAYKFIPTRLTLTV